MTAILQKHLPEDMCSPRGLPGTQPERGPWLRVDEAYGAQMALRARLLRDRPGDVLYLDGNARPAAEELLDTVLDVLPRMGFAVRPHTVTCPDGRVVDLDRAAPLATLGRLCQCDFVLMQKRQAEHVLTGAVLCFPASWRLAEKAERPLTAIHRPVPDYDDALARRVQRLFDGVQVGRPLWRFNMLWYADPSLFQPRSEQTPREVHSRAATGAYLRAERQTVLRLPRTRACVFIIHTFVLAPGDVPDLI